MITLGMEHNSRWHGFVIFSVGTLEAEFQRWMISQNIAFKQLIGCCFEGPGGPNSTETSFMVNADDFELVQADNWVNGQDSVLVLSPQEPHKNGRRRATLVFTDPRREPRDLGLFTGVTEAEAKASPYWTYDPALQEYWVTKPDGTYKPPHPGLEDPTARYSYYPGLWAEGNISDA